MLLILFLVIILALCAIMFLYEDKENLCLLKHCTDFNILIILLVKDAGDGP